VTDECPTGSDVAAAKEWTRDGPGDTSEAIPAVSTDNTVLPRHLTANPDNILALILGIIAAKSSTKTHSCCKFWRLLLHTSDSTSSRRV